MGYDFAPFDFLSKLYQIFTVVGKTGREAETVFEDNEITIGAAGTRETDDAVCGSFYGSARSGSQVDP